jgi:hypothetical protein
MNQKQKNPEIIFKLLAKKRPTQIELGVLLFTFYFSHSFSSLILYAKRSSFDFHPLFNISSVT